MPPYLLARALLIDIADCIVWFVDLFVEETYMRNRLNYRQTFAASVLLAILMQMCPFGISAQSFKNNKASEVKAEEVRDDKQDIQTDSIPQTKIAPDLQENVDDLSNGFRGDELQRVIIQLKPATEINNLLGDEVSQEMKEQCLPKKLERTNPALYR